MITLVTYFCISDVVNLIFLHLSPKSQPLPNKCSPYELPINVNTRDMKAAMRRMAVRLYLRPWIVSSQSQGQVTSEYHSAAWRSTDLGN